MSEIGELGIRKNLITSPKMVSRNKTMSAVTNTIESNENDDKKDTHIRELK